MSTKTKGLTSIFQMLILGTIFQCIDPVLTVAASLSSKSLFVSPMDKREEANRYLLRLNTWNLAEVSLLWRARERFARGNSDLLTDANAYSECIQLRNEGVKQSAIRVFCEEVRSTRYFALVLYLIFGTELHLAIYCSGHNLAPQWPLRVPYGAQLCSFIKYPNFSITK